MAMRDLDGTVKVSPCRYAVATVTPAARLLRRRLHGGAREQQHESKLAQC